MALTLQFKRYTTNELSSITGAVGELIVDTDKDTVTVHDGSAAGGVALATESYVTTAVSNLVDTAPGTLDTLNELAAALGDDANFSTTVTNSLAAKQDTLVSGTSIKTVGGTSLLGSGDVAVPSAPSLTTLTSTATVITGDAVLTFSANDLVFRNFTDGAHIAGWAPTAGDVATLQTNLVVGSTFSFLLYDGSNYYEFNATVATTGAVTYGGEGSYFQIYLSALTVNNSSFPAPNNSQYTTAGSLDFNYETVGDGWDIDLSTASVFRILPGSTTYPIAFSNASDADEVTLAIRTSSTGVSVSFPTNVQWPGAVAPTMSTTAFRYDVVKLVKILNTWYPVSFMQNLGQPGG